MPVAATRNIDGRTFYLDRGYTFGSKDVAKQAARNLLRKHKFIKSIRIIQSGSRWQVWWSYN